MRPNPIPSLCGYIGHRKDRANGIPQCKNIQSLPKKRGNPQVSELTTVKLLEDFDVSASTSHVGDSQYSTMQSILFCSIHLLHFHPNSCPCITVDQRSTASMGSQLTASKMPSHFTGRHTNKPIISYHISSRQCTVKMFAPELHSAKAMCEILCHIDLVYVNFKPQGNAYRVIRYEVALTTLRH